MEAIERYEPRLQLVKTDREFAEIARDIREFGILDLQRDFSLDHMMDAREKTKAIESYLPGLIKDRGLQLEAQNDLAELRIRQERRIGYLLTNSERQTGRPLKNSPTMRPFIYAEIGIDKRQAGRWQIEARIPDEIFEEFVSQTRAAKKEITSAGVIKLGKRQSAPSIRESGLIDGCRVVTDLNELVEEGCRFSTFYIDPPWRYSNKSTRSAAEGEYQTMSIEEIMALPIPELTNQNAHLHLWVTKAFLPDGLTIIKHWGFEYKGWFAWCKRQIGIGNYWRSSTELLLLGVKGSLVFRDHSERDWIETGRTVHSEKPEEIRKKIERVSEGPYLECFARMVIPGWTVFGNQVWRPDGLNEMKPINGPLFGGVQ